MRTQTLYTIMRMIVALVLLLGQAAFSQTVTLPTSFTGDAAAYQA